ncbi:DUF3990 domain-containing protein [Bacillus cereus]|uniref:DUF3990 domain-containing protein n=1 Tax=Bacillus toyonensis TaxID=155322 RepID=UPI000BF78C7B|nr:DUF3990 domain-containing protein [Bacillus toyonensis]PFZ72401.1 hypothetical protein COL72_11230 [Bacillus toyonensis]
MTNLSVSGVRELDFTDVSDYLYHGTCGFKDKCDVATVDNIDVKKGNKRVDFGPGFYVCIDKKQAEKRARSVYMRENKNQNSTMRVALEKLKIPMKVDLGEVQEALVIRYKIDINKVSDIEHKRLFASPDIKWFNFIFNNRKYSPEGSLEHNHDAKYSIVYGYMADGLFESVTELLKKKYEDLSTEELKTIYEVYTRKKQKIETQISFHRKEALNHCLSNGDIFQLEI